MTSELILWMHAVATIYMVGLIWFVQVVHYPLMGLVGEPGFSRYAERHQVLTTIVVAPAMLLEVATAVWLVIDTPAGAGRFGVLLGGVLLVVIWLSTTCVQVPCHGRLSAGYDAATWRRLVRSNWVRTVAWTVRGWVAIDLLRSAELP